MSLVLYIGNSNVIELQALTNTVTDAVDTGATVTVTITDTADVEVSGQVWPATMSHTSGGTYRATLEDDIALVARTKYKAVIDVIGSGGEVGKWIVTVVPTDRTGC